MIATATIVQNSQGGAVMPAVVAVLVVAAGPPLPGVEATAFRFAEGDPPVAVVAFARALPYDNQNKPSWSQRSL
jgi:hypothetical protein